MDKSLLKTVDYNSLLCSSTLQSSPKKLRQSPLPFGNLDSDTTLLNSDLRLKRAHILQYVCSSDTACPLQPKLRI